MEQMIDNTKHSEGYQAVAYFERIRIWESIEKLYENSRNTRTPLYQDDMYNHLKNIVWEVHPPRQFRDLSNGE